jgi:phosphoribosyl 1,2-cyclic phosphodiesterase
MIVRFWGVRGSFPAPGAATAKIGGNTASVSVETDGQVLVVDAGTGIRELGKALVGDPREITILTSHVHWDHVIGIPFFAPLYEKGRTVNLGCVRHGGRAGSPLEIVDGVHFPRHLSDLPATVHIVEDEAAFLRQRGFSFQTIELSHPGGATGFRIGQDRGDLVYMTDNELGGGSEARARFPEFVTFAAGARLLCHDAQYLPAEIEHRRGWGHSTVEEACELAVAAEVEHLVLFHHDPDRDDDAVLRIEHEARERLATRGIACTAAYEGLSIAID